MKRILFLLAALPLFLGSCNKDDNGTDPDTGGKTDSGDIVFQIAIGSQMQTKVATEADFKSVFENGDEIGIFAVSHASGTPKALAASGNYIHNAKLTYSTADGGKWTAASGLWYATGGNELDFYAYYPYNATANNPTAITFNVLADQSTTLNYGKSDLLSASAMNVAKSTNPVTLTFAHKLALVQVEVDPTYIDRSGGFTVMLNNCKAGVGFNLGTNLFTTSGNAQSVMMLRVEKSTDANYSIKYTYRALVPAQTVVAGTSLCLMAQNGQPYVTPSLAAPLDFTAGEAKFYTVKLPTTLMQRVIITASTFIMGQAGLSDPVHNVTFTKGFYMSKYQITNAQYAAFLNAQNIRSDAKGNVTYYKTNFTSTVTENQTLNGDHPWGVQWNSTNNKWVPATGKDNFPLIDATWYGAKAYADWIGGSLPTEAQWEYACRAGRTTIYSYGDTPNGEYMWYNINSGSTSHEVGTSLPNTWGLYDMHGNVWEWCSDWYGGYSSGNASDPRGATTGTMRVLRGGSWNDNDQSSRSAFRHANTPDYTNPAIGFRVVFVP